MMIRSLNAIWKVDPGFRADNVLTFWPNLSAVNAKTGVRAWFGPSLRQLSDDSGPHRDRAVFTFDRSGSAADEDDLFFWLESQPSLRVTAR